MELTKELEKRIRRHTKMALRLPYDEQCCVLNPEVAQGLLGEIDRLRKNLKRSTAKLKQLHELVEYDDDEEHEDNNHFIKELEDDTND